MLCQGNQEQVLCTCVLHCVLVVWLNSWAIPSFILYIECIQVGIEIFGILLRVHFGWKALSHVAGIEQRFA